MTSPTLDDAVLRQARARASAGAWPEVADLLRGELGPVAVRPERVTLYAEALMRVGEPRRACDCLQQAMPVLSRGAHRSAHRTALNLLGAASFAIGALDDAQGAWDRVLELAQRAGDPLLVGRAMNNLGAVASLRGDWHRAIYLYQLAVPIYQRLGDAHRLAETFHNLAIVHRDLDNLVQADEHEMRAIEFAQQAGAQQLELMARAGRAELALRRGDHELAAVSALAAGGASAAIGDRSTQADAWRCAGEAYTALGKHDAARRLLDEAATLAELSGQALMQAEVLLASARLGERTGERDRARFDARRAMERFAALGARTGQARSAALLEELGAGAA
jgi:tetratricopeptide (TPR) repeat protein